MERDKRIDALKGWAILLVVVGHIISITEPEYSKNLVFILIYSFHMPLFMVISGYLSYGKITFDWLLKRFFQLMIPYTFFTLLLNFGVYGIKITIQNTITALSSTTYWFLPTLFVCLFFLFLIVKNILYGGLTLITLGVILLLYNYPLLIFLFWYSSFLFLGYIAKQNEKSIPWVKYFLPTILTMILCVSQKDLITKGTTEFFVYKFIVALVGIALSVYLIYSIRYLKITPLLTYLGRRTLEIYVIHIFLIDKTVRSITGFDLSWGSGWMAVIGGSVVVIFLSLLLTTPFKRGVIYS